MKITTEIVQKLITEQFPQWQGQAIVPIEPGGWDNRSFKLCDTMLIRLPSAQCYEAQVHKEQHWLPILAQFLSIDIPKPVAKGIPSNDYPFVWSIYNWIDGETVFNSSAIDKICLAKDLAKFLNELQAADATSGPPAGEQNFYRGATLKHYEPQVHDALARLSDSYDTKKLERVWANALSSSFDNSPVWVHGDISPGNLIVQNGQLSAVIDFGCLAVGDPACDYAIAWSYFDEKSRQIFYNESAIDEDTWNRGRGWALWKALIIEAGICDSNAVELDRAKHWGDENHVCFS